MFVKKSDYLKMTTLLTETDEANARMSIGLLEEVNIHHDIIEELVDAMGLQIVIKDDGVSLAQQKPIKKKGKK